MDTKLAVVGILNKYGDVQGTGFVVSEKLIITCAHVIEQATGGTNDQVHVRFVADNSLALANVDATTFSSSTDRDIALLQVKSLPPKAKALTLTSASGSSGHDFYAYGFASAAGEPEIGARGQIIDIVSNGCLLQLTSQELDYGMSGAPVLDTNDEAVIGMVIRGATLSKKAKGFRNQLTSFAISADAIHEVCLNLPLASSDPFSNVMQVKTTHLHGVPRLPPYYLPRYVKLDLIRTSILSAKEKKKLKILIHGIPGTGKSLLAAALARDEIAQGFFCKLSHMFPCKVR